MQVTIVLLHKTYVLKNLPVKKVLDGFSWILSEMNFLKEVSEFAWDALYNYYLFKKNNIPNISIASSTVGEEARSKEETIYFSWSNMRV